MNSKNIIKYKKHNNNNISLNNDNIDNIIDNTIDNKIDNNINLIKEEFIDNNINICPLFSSNSIGTGNQYKLPNNLGYLTSFTRKGNQQQNIQISNNETKSSEKLKLFADEIWPGSIVLSDYLCDNKDICLNKSVIELGAGEGCLPSLVASKFNSKYVVITDYPLPEILDNINNIISINSNNLNKDNIKIRGLEWGNINDIKACNAIPVLYGDGNDKYEVLLLAELLWKDTYSLHRKLLITVVSLMADNGIAFVSFAHRPSADLLHKPVNDLEFFEIAKNEFNLIYKHVLTCNRYRDIGDDVTDDGIEVHLYSLKK